MLKKLSKSKSILSMILAFAMMFSFVGFSDSASAAVVPTNSFELIINSGTPETITESYINGLSTYGLRHYSAIKKGGIQNYYTTKGATLEQILSSNLAAINKTTSDIDSVFVLCSDGFSRTFTNSELFGSFNYYAAGSRTGTAVDTTIGTSATDSITSNEALLDKTTTLRLFAGQTSSDDVNNYKYMSGITHIVITTN